jgi:hypothetical protein
MTWSAFYLLLSITLFPTQPPAHLNATAWLEFVKQTCKVYNVDHYWLLALCKIESNFQFGQLGKTPFYGPGGLNKHCDNLKEINLNNPYIATWATIRAVKGCSNIESRWFKRLQIYNSDWKNNKSKWWKYWKAIEMQQRRYKMEGFIR